MFQSVNLPLFDLIDNHLPTSQSLLFLLSFDFLLFFDFLQSFQFHNFVFLLLLGFEILPISLFLFQLSLTNCGSFGICNHFIHFLYFVELLLRHFDCSLVYRTTFCQSLSLKLVRGHPLLFLFFESKHFFAFSFCQR